MAAAGVEIDTRVDRRRIAIGDTFNLHLDLTWGAGIDVKPLALTERLGSFVVRDVRRGLAVKDGDRMTRQISLLLTVFETGTRTIPPVEVVYVDSAGVSGKVESAPLEISIESLLSEDDSDIRDIKGPIDVPRRWRDMILSYLMLVGLAAGAAASVLVSVKRRDELEALMRRLAGRIIAPLRWLLLSIMALIRGRGRAAEVFDIEVREPSLNAEETALRELGRIEALGLIERGMIKEHYSLVSETLRRYIERKHGVLAMESPTSMTLLALEDLKVDGGFIAEGRALLEECDLVKFARFVPADRAAASLLDRAREMVRMGPEPASMGEGEAL
jgi:hypothetical protein